MLVEVFSPRITRSGSQHFGADLIRQTKFAVKNFKIVEKTNVFYIKACDSLSLILVPHFDTFWVLSSSTSELILDLHIFG